MCVVSMGGGVIYFCEVVCVVLRLYLKRKNAQTLQYKIYSNLFILMWLPIKEKPTDPPTKTIITLFNPKTLGCT